MTGWHITQRRRRGWWESVLNGPTVTTWSNCTVEYNPHSQIRLKDWKINFVKTHHNKVQYKWIQWTEKIESAAVGWWQPCLVLFVRSRASVSLQWHKGTCRIYIWRGKSNKVCKFDKDLRKYKDTHTVCLIFCAAKHDEAANILDLQWSDRHSHTCTGKHFIRPLLSNALFNFMIVEHSSKIRTCSVDLIVLIKIQNLQISLASL